MDKLALYVHWPWCTRICPYCDFNVYKATRADTGILMAAMLAHLESWRQRSGPRDLVSIHFGGGTPSLMSPQNISDIISAARSLWSPSTHMEVGLEANPDDADKEKWRAYKRAGINRLSLGVQSFDNQVLTFLGRIHDAAAAQRALTLARDIFDNISCDLIFGHHGQSLEDMAQDLDIALSHKPDHISAYQLTLEQNTAFALKAARGETIRVGEDQSADLYEYVRERLRGEGFNDYEVSNFSKDKKFESRHNRAYWDGLDYAAIGPGGHGRLTIKGTRRASVNAARPAEYIDAVKTLNANPEMSEAMSPGSWAEEYVLMGLRVKTGISLARFEQIAGTPLSPTHVNNMVSAGAIYVDGDRLKATDQGRLLLDYVSAKLLTG